RISLHVTAGRPSVIHVAEQRSLRLNSIGQRHMPTEREPDGQWDRVASELRAYREAQQRAWGDIDNATLGRYLANEADGAERQRVEHALEELPELRRLTDLVRDVLAGAAPVGVPAAP